MKRLPMNQLRGARDLLQDAVEAGANASEKVQRAMTAKPYGILKKIRPIAAPVAAVEQVQIRIADKVYQAVRAVNRLSYFATGKALDGLEVLQPPVQKK